MTTAGKQFARFAAVGAAGFVVDAALLQAAIWWLGTGPYVGRVLSFLGAATFTWAANRAYTFAGASDSIPLVQWLRFLIANSAGAAINFASYSAIVAWAGAGGAWPVIGVAVGSISGLGVNFAASRLWVFR
jgi:putative flippase GtrA